MRRTASTKGAKAKADRLFSLIIRSKGYCENCGKASNLQCAHIISRRYSATRCVLSNAFCLCAGCHHYFTDHPVEFASFVHEHRSVHELETLNQLNRLGTKVDWGEVASRLSETWEKCTKRGNR